MHLHTVYTDLQIDVFTHRQRHADTHIHTHPYKYVHTQPPPTHTQTYLCRNKRTRTYTEAHMHTCTQAGIIIQTYRHVHKSSHRFLSNTYAYMNKHTKHASKPSCMNACMHVHFQNFLFFLSNSIHTQTHICKYMHRNVQAQTRT